MFKNKSLSLFFFLFTLCSCGFSTNGEALGDINAEGLQDQYFQNDSGSIKIYLKRNEDFNGGKYSRLLIYFPVLKKHPEDVSPLKDFFFAIKIQEFNPGAPSQQDGSSSEPDKEPPLLQTMILTFGDLGYAQQFIDPQEKDKEGRVALTNLQRQSGVWNYKPLYKQKLKDLLNLPVPTFFYSINNIYGGCALNCQGSTAIIPAKDSKNKKTTDYALMLWITDSLSPKEIRMDRSYTTLKMDIGYIDNRGYFRSFEPSIDSVKLDFSSKETEYSHKKRIRKEKKAVLEEQTSNSSKLSKFFSTITKTDENEKTS